MPVVATSWKGASGASDRIQGLNLAAYVALVLNRPFAVDPDYISAGSSHANITTPWGVTDSIFKEDRHVLFPSLASKYSGVPEHAKKTLSTLPEGKVVVVDVKQTPNRSI